MNDTPDTSPDTSIQDAAGTGRDPMLKAFNAVVRALAPLDERAQQRVLAAARALYEPGFADVALAARRAA